KAVARAIEAPEEEPTKLIAKLQAYGLTGLQPNLNLPFGSTSSARRSRPDLTQSSPRHSRPDLTQSSPRHSRPDLTGSSARHLRHELSQSQITSRRLRASEDAHTTSGLLQLRTGGHPHGT